MQSSEVTYNLADPLSDLRRCFAVDVVVGHVIWSRDAQRWYDSVAWSPLHTQTMTVRTLSQQRDSETYTPPKALPPCTEITIVGEAIRDL